jgi:hypothetical protein
MRPRPMLYVPRAGNPAPLGWLALRPVERWQFAGFLEVAWTRGGRKAGDFHPMDGKRLLAGPETEPVTRVLRDEASLYTQWFGKLVPSRIDWQLAAESLDPAQLWGAVIGFRTIVGHRYGLITETGAAEAIRMSLRDQAPRDR